MLRAALEASVREHAEHEARVHSAVTLSGPGSEQLAGVSAARSSEDVDLASAIAASLAAVPVGGGGTSSGRLQQPAMSEKEAMAAAMEESRREAARREAAEEARLCEALALSRRQAVGCRREQEWCGPIINIDVDAPRPPWSPCDEGSAHAPILLSSSDDDDGCDGTVATCGSGGGGSRSASGACSGDGVVARETTSIPTVLVTAAEPTIAPLPVSAEELREARLRRFLV